MPLAQNHVALAGVRGRKAPETVQTRGRVNDTLLLRAVGLRLDLLDEHEARAPRRAGGTPHRMRRVEGDLVDLERIVVGGPSAAEGRRRGGQREVDGRIAPPRDELVA